MIISTLLFLVQFPFAAHAETEFQKHPAVVEAMTCKELDYNSYFRAQNAKSGIISGNPDRSKPNFGGKYLLLKNALMLETQWLIADCKTGKFFHETLYGIPEFKIESMVAIVSEEPAKGKPIEGIPELKLWNGEKWTSILPSAEATSSSAIAPAKDGEPTNVPADPSSILQKYSALFITYPAPYSEPPCKELDFNSFFRAKNSKDTIVKLNPDRTKPNFAGKYLILRNELMLETQWLLAECQTGKFLPESLSGNLNFKKDSALVVLSESGSAPQLKVWIGSQWKSISDPVKTTPQKIINTLYGDHARALSNSLPNPGKNSTIRFENLECTGSIDQCHVDVGDKKALAVKPEHLAAMASTMKNWAVKNKILEGKCSKEKPPLVCEIVTE